MTQRLQKLSSSGRRTARGRPPRSRLVGEQPPPGDWGTIPVRTPTIPDLPVVEGTGPPGPPPAAAVTWVPAPRETFAVLRRADVVGAAALALAGVAANVSLFLSWTPGAGPTGLSLIERFGEALDGGLAEPVLHGVWEPPVVVLCGGVLVLLGLLLLVPARAHRVLGVLALVVALAATAAVLLVVSDLDWQVERFGPGLWFAVAVPVLGLLGALKAMLTAPRVTLVPAEPTGPTVR